MEAEKIYVIRKFEEYSNWLNNLRRFDCSAWEKPFAPGKWSPSEIISHILNWDNYLLKHILPSVKKGEGMEFPEFEPFNLKASEYAKSGIAQTDLLHEAIVTRQVLIHELLKVPEKELCWPLTSNGISHCPYTGKPYSLLYIINEFIEHDHHHQQQVNSCFNEFSN